MARLAYDPTGAVLVSMPAYRGVMRPRLRPATVWRPDGACLSDLPTIPLAATPTAVAVGPGGAWVAVGLSDYDRKGPVNALKVWDITGRELAGRPVRGTVDDIRPLPDGGLLVAAGGSIWRHDVRLATAPKRLTAAAELVRVAVATDGRLAGASKAVAAVCDLTGQVLTWREHKKSPQNGPVAFRPHSTVLAVGHGTVVDLWDFASGAEVVLTGHKRPVWAVGFGPDGGTAYTAASDGAVIAWDADTGAVRERFDFGTGKLYSAAVSPNGLTLALGGDDGRMTVVDLDG